jgi:hypothetical protein
LIASLARVPRQSHPASFLGRPLLFYLTLTNSLLFVDLIIWPQIDLSLWRAGVTLTGLACLIYGLIFDAQS